VPVEDLGNAYNLNSFVGFCSYRFDIGSN
jgi:hypothetical protein